ncbi:MAG TPA: sodium:glutamate symporter [Gammaproteobacteria bacterium]|jgi:ESS family glutamate:Na+ symporter|nr:sodium:glutamate symporter [Gammaproteobacteria bacterium]HAJ30902.1 sodium:glutamate symporter [Gammaproteobacteria bacterium]
MAQTFPGILSFAFLAALLVFGTLIRANVRFFQINLVPASLIGGTLGFGLIALDWAMGFKAADFTAFAFHFFTLSFMSLVLTSRAQPIAGQQPVALGGLWLSLIWVICLVLQALVGLAAISAYNTIASEPLSGFLGLIATHGFTQGPGQALALGDLWTTAYNIQHAVDFGLIYASLGFVAAFAVGVPMARWILKKNLHSGRGGSLDQDFERGLYSGDAAPASGKLITHSANVDSFAFHIGLLGCAYLITDQYLKLVHPFVAGTHFENIFSYNLFFFHGLMICVGLRALLDRFSLGQFVDDETQKRITGSSVDLMVTASLLSINFALLTQFWQPILLVASLVTLVTAALCFTAGLRLKTLGAERGLTIFGCCCGSTGSGILLLRILDPNLASSVAKELAFFNIAILFLSFHILAIMAPILPSIPVIWIILIYLATAGFGLILVQLLGSKMSGDYSQKPEPG